MRRPELFRLIFTYRRHALILLAAALLLFLFFSEIKSIVVVILLALIGGFGQIYKRYVRITSAVEFVTFGTVVVSIAYGWVAGALFALTVSFASEVISGNIDAFMLVYLPVRTLSGVFAAFLPFGSVFITGIGTVLFINLLSQPVYLLQSDAEIRIKGIIYLIVNVFFNVLLFSAFGDFALKLAN